MERIVRKEDLCKCDPMQHTDHQLCQSCKSKVPVPLELMGFTNSTSWCSKCPKGSSGYNLREQFGASYTVKII